MTKEKIFKSKNGSLKLPVFFPDATRGVVKSLDSKDIENTKTPGVLVNTYHLYNELGKRVLEKHGGIRGFMGWQGGVISDSGGFQVMSLAKSGKGSITNKGVIFRPSRNKKILFTPEKSIQFQMKIKPDMLVVLDDFTEPGADYETARDTVERTINWAKRCKEEFIKICEKEKISEEKRPYLLAVVQGGEFEELRKECAQRLVEIGFDGFGYGGWPIKETGEFNFEVAKWIKEVAPENYLLYGLGIGKPEEIVGCVQLGFDIFDCVLPTRDARHKRLYIYNAKSIEEIDVTKPKFYSYHSPQKERHYNDTRPVSTACDCQLCQNYSRAYLNHLFKIGDFTAGRLATIHNLRFYSLLMKNLQTQ